MRNLVNGDWYIFTQESVKAGYVVMGVRDTGYVRVGYDGMEISFSGDFGTIDGVDLI